MKKLINRILVLIMATVFVVGTMGINVFSHFCSHCHVAHYSVDITPVDELACECDVDCACHCNSGEDSKKGSEHCKSFSSSCMHSHDHEFFHIDDSYEIPEKLSCETIYSIEYILNYVIYNNIENNTSIVYKNYLDRPYVPDIVSMNCTMLC